MDPMSAIGLASSIVAFIDFSWKLVAGTWEIYHAPDGTSRENAQLEDVVDDLKSLSLPLQADCLVNTSSGKKIKRLAQYCQEDSQTLLDLLSGLRVAAGGKRRTIWSSLNAKWKSILKRDEVSQLKSQLQDNRAEIQFHLTAMIQDRQSAFGIQLSNLENDSKDLKIDTPRQLHQLRNDLLKAIEDEKSSVSRTESGPLTDIKKQLQDMQSLLATIPLQHRVLRHLVSDSMESRREQILDANPDTCRWLLEVIPDPEVSNASPSESWSERENRLKQQAELISRRRETRNDFISWLATGQDVLHISGNAGSGKSTLMKFIGQHKRTRKELEAWAGAKQLVFAQFYFWAAGADSERTLPGLYRSLLFQTLSQCPELIDKVFPSQLARMRSPGFQDDRAIEKLQSFNDTQIRDAFDLLLQQTKHAHHKICFLLDGLDEFEGNRLDHENLAIKLRDWTAEGDVKLLVSSRPWQEFLDVFSEIPPIHLHKLNRFDIRTYCLSMLAKDREIRRRGNDQITIGLKDVVKSIVDQSQGIFLWAHLVLDAILQGVRQSDSVATLKAKVEEYPMDLDSLYTKLRQPIDKSDLDRATSNRMLLLAARKPDRFRLTAMAFSWILEDAKGGLLDPGFPTETACQPYSEDEIARRLDQVTKQMNGLTRGLLEISQENSWRRDDVLKASFGKLVIQFSHRSARDYLLLNEARCQAMSESWQNFNDTDVYGRIHLAEFLYGFDPALIASVRRYLTPSPDHSYRHNFDIRTIQKFEAPIQSFLRSEWLYGGAAPLHDEDDSAVSFIQWHAYWGMPKFVLSEVFEPHRNLHSPGSSILLAIHSRIMNFGLPLLLQLVERRIGLDNMVPLNTGKKTLPHEIPAWAVLFYQIMLNFTDMTFKKGQRQVKYDQWSRSRVAILRYLHEYSGQVGQHLSFTFRVFSEANTEDFPQFPNSEFTSADILECLEGGATDARKAIAASNTAVLGESSHNSCTGDDQAVGRMQQTLGEWQQKAFDSGIILQLRICGLHWNSIHVESPMGNGLNYRVI